MKRSIAFFALVAFLSAAAIAAPSKTTSKPVKAKPAIGTSGSALGAFLGEPTGLTFRTGIAKDESFEMKAAWAFGSSSALHVEANWTFEFPGLVVIEGENLIPYLGGGGFLQVTSSAPVIGLHMPAGIVYRFSEIPLELALEFQLGMALMPSTGFEAGGGLAVRYRFSSAK